MCLYILWNTFKAFSCLLFKHFLPFTPTFFGSQTVATENITARLVVMTLLRMRRVKSSMGNVVFFEVQQ